MTKIPKLIKKEKAKMLDNIYYFGTDCVDLELQKRIEEEKRLNRKRSFGHKTGEKK